MNWSTRLRRWVRIRTPPVREASMKPTAATVLPEPVACSNQKRRLAPGSSGASSTTSSSSSASSQSWASSSSVASSSLLGGVSPSRSAASPSASTGFSRLGLRGRRGGVAVARPGRAVEPLLDVGDQRRERAGESVELMGVELRRRRRGGAPPRRAPARARASGRSRAATRSRALRGPASISARAASRARRLGVPAARSFGFSPSSRKGSRANSRALLDVGARRRLGRFGGRLGGISHEAF